MTAEAKQQPETQAEMIRADILRHATDLFSHYGFNKTNIGDIAERCCMSPGNLYRYFRNKQAIGLATVQIHFDVTENAIDSALETCEGTAEQRIRVFFETGIAHIAHKTFNTPKIVELAEFLCENEDGVALLEVHIGWKRQRLAREIARGIASDALNDVDPDETAATMLNVFKAFWMPMTLANWRDEATILPEMHAILDLIFTGLIKRA